MRLLGQLEEGVYIDDLEDVNPEELDMYYGVHGPAHYHPPGVSGAGHPSDEESDDDDDDDGPVDIDLNEADPPAAPQVPESHNPFNNDDVEHVFHEAFHLVCEEGVVPAGYNILPNEWDEDGYPTVEILRTGRRGRREIKVGLTDEIWRPRAVLWVQALDVLTRLLDAEI